MSTQALAKVEDAALMEWDELLDMEFEPDGSEEIALIFPTISLVQSTSQFPESSKHVGQFWHSDREDYTEELEGVGLFMTYSQALFEQDSKAPSCSSLDGQVPRPNQKLWLSDDGTWHPRGSQERKTIPLPHQPLSCATCPMNLWIGDNAPACQRSIILSLWRGDDKTIANFRFGGTALKPFQQFVGTKLVHRNRKLPLSAMGLRFYSSEETKPGKKWQQLHVEGRPMPVAEVRQFEAFKNEIRGLVKQSQEQIIDTQESEPVDVTPTGNWHDGGDNLNDGFED